VPQTMSPEAFSARTQSCDNLALRPVAARPSRSRRRAEAQRILFAATARGPLTSASPRLGANNLRVSRGDAETRRDESRQALIQELGSTCLLPTMPKVHSNDAPRFSQPRRPIPNPGQCDSLKPLPFRGGVGVGPIDQRGARGTAPPPTPPLKGRGHKCRSLRCGIIPRVVELGNIGATPIQNRRVFLPSAPPRLRANKFFCSREAAETRRSDSDAGMIQHSARSLLPTTTTNQKAKPKKDKKFPAIPCPAGNSHQQRLATVAT
jgi:hypothetical protein